MNIHGTVLRKSEDIGYFSTTTHFWRMMGIGYIINPLTERVDMTTCNNDTRGELDPRVAEAFDAAHPRGAWEK